MYLFRPTKQRNILQDAQDHNSYPFSNSLLSTTLPYDYRVNLDPPPVILQRLFFPEDRQSVNVYRSGGHASRFLTESEINGQPKPRLFDTPAPWKLISRGDQENVSGWTSFIPRGTFFDKISTSRRIRGRKYDQPSLHRLDYQNLQFVPGVDNAREEHQRGPPFVSESENAARKSLHNAKTQFVVSLGHDESEITNDEHECFQSSRYFNIAGENHIEFDRLRHRPTCGLNNGVHAVISNLDLKAKCEEDQQPLANVFVLKTKARSHPQHIEEQQRLNRSLGFSHVRDADIAEQRLFARELGLLRCDAGLQLSMDRKQNLNMMDEGNNVFLAHSPKFQRQKRAFIDLGPLGNYPVAR